jgi:hypothetical protein
MKYKLFGTSFVVFFEGQNELVTEYNRNFQNGDRV